MANFELSIQQPFSVTGKLKVLRKEERKFQHPGKPAAKANEFSNSDHVYK